MQISDLSGLVGSFATVIAAIAGYKAVKKWKSDELDRIRISCSENLYEAQADCFEKLNDLMRPDYDVFFNDEGVLEKYKSLPRPIRHILSNKHVSLIALKHSIERLNVATHRAVEIEGESAIFVSNYLRTTYYHVGYCFKKLEQLGIKYPIDFASEQAMVVELDDDDLEYVLAIINVHSFLGNDAKYKSYFYDTTSMMRKASIRQKSLVYSSGIQWVLNKSRLYFIKHNLRDEVVLAGKHKKNLVVALHGSISRQKPSGSSSNDNVVIYHLHLAWRELKWATNVFWRS